MPLWLLGILPKVKAAASWAWARILWVYEPDDSNKHRRAVLTVVIALLVIFKYQPLSLFPSITKTIEAAPDTPLKVGPGGVTSQPKAGKDGKPVAPRKDWFNPSANLGITPVKDPETGKPALKLDGEVFAFRFVPRISCLYAIDEKKILTYIGTQVCFLDAFGLGAGINPRPEEWEKSEIAVILDRRFKVAEIENLAIAGAVAFPFDQLASGIFSPHFRLGLDFYLGR